MSSVGNSSAGTGYSETLYYPHKETYSGCNGFWLSSPCGSNEERVVRVYCNGYVGDELVYLGNKTVGIRPLVRLKSGVTLTENTTTTGIDYDINVPSN